MLSHGSLGPNVGYQRLEEDDVPKMAAATPDDFDADEPGHGDGKVVVTEDDVCILVTGAPYLALICRRTDGFYGRRTR